jgi:protein-S-isoprenylcysteine O-methyltransferase Ste14
MQKYIAVLTIILMIGLVMIWTGMLKKRGIAAMNFGKIDKTDYLIPPFALFYFYLVFANTFNLPTFINREFFHSNVLSWIGVFFCLLGLILVLWSLISFGHSFRVGIDLENPGKLITTGIFALSRNPIYGAFFLILLGQFLIFSNWIPLIFIGAAIWLFHRQVLREENYLKKLYGKEYLEYCKQVRRYI